MYSELLTVKEICKIIDKSYTSVLRYIRSGQLKSITILHGKPTYRVKREELERFLGKKVDRKVRY